jgi:hypothetical protein
VLLLKEHHAVQGVLQSEEYQHCCIWGWEANYLDGEMLAMCKKWHSTRARLSHANRTPEGRSTASRMGHSKRTPEQRRATAAATATTLCAINSKRTSEQRRANVAAANAATRVLNSERTPEQRCAATAAANRARRKPLRITYPYGRIETSEIMTACAVKLGVKIQRIQKILNRENKYLHSCAGCNSPSTGIRIEYA